MRLPAKQRARLAHELIRSLEGEPPEDPAEVERAWAKEIDRRVREIDSGKAKLLDWADVRRDIDRTIRNVRRRRRRRPAR